MNLSLSNALLDGNLRHKSAESSDEEEEELPETHFPSLVYDDPYKGLYRTILIKPRVRRPRPPPPSSSVKSSPPPQRVLQGLQRRTWDDVITQFFSKKKKSLLRNSIRVKTGTLSRSLSWDNLRSEDEDTDAVEELKTFVYKPRVNRRQRKDSPNNKATPMANSAKEDNLEFCDAEMSSPIVPPRNSKLSEEDLANVYEIPVITKPVKKERKRRESAPAMMFQLPPQFPIEAPKPAPRQKKKPPEAVKPEIVEVEERRVTFTAQDIAVPAAAKVEVVKPSAALTGDVGLLQISVLAIRVPQKPLPKEHDSDSEDRNEKSLSAQQVVAPKDQLFCVLSIEGKHSQFESTLQTLNPIKQAAVWNQTEVESATFYALHSQTLYAMSRKLPIESSNKGDAECIGVGMQPLSFLKPFTVGKDKRGSVDDWSKSCTDCTEATIALEPSGSLLLKMSYNSLHPQAPVTCSGILTITGITGVDCVREDEPCWTCCTVDIDTENYGTTSSRLGKGDQLSEGWKSEPIEFDVTESKLCRIQLWGFTSQETEYWFGEVYIPLGILCPYSKHFVSEDDKSGSLNVTKSFERNLTMPIEPKGLINLHFVLSPNENPDGGGGVNVAIRVLEESGLFNPEDLTKLKNEIEIPQCDTIPEENETSSTSKKTVMASGAYDHLEPTTSKINSLSRSKKMTLRMLGNIKFQVPTSYDERKHKLNTEIDPYRELEIIKVELKDIKAKLAISEFQKEKAELRVKTLEEENWKLKQKVKKKK